MNIPITITVATSKAFTSKEGKRFVKLQGMALGFGIFEMIVDEKRIPDQLEGKTVKANFKLFIDRNFKFGLSFDGIAGS